MAVTFNVPQSPEKSKMVIDEFLGVDFTSAPDMVDIRRSPNAPNMVPSCPGKVRKSMGYEFDTEVPSAYTKGETLIKTWKFSNGSAVYQYSSFHIDDLRGSFIERNGRVNWVEQIDNGSMMGYTELSGAAYVALEGMTFNVYDPTITISRNPNGGGTPYEPLNMLSPWFYDSFLGTATDKNYVLSFNNLSYVEVEVLQANGTWKTLEENVDYWYNGNTGVVTFATAPGLSPVTGEDNVKIHAELYSTAYAKNAWQRLGKCVCSCIYNTNGQRRLVVGGNTDSLYKNRFWFSEPNNLSYIPDVNYAFFGESTSGIIGLGSVGDYLAVFKDSLETHSTVGLFVAGNMESGTSYLSYFKSVASLQASPLIAPRSINYLNGELLYLSNDGINAIALVNNSSERASVKRGYYLDGKLNVEPYEERVKAVATIYKNKYILLVNNQLYILDGEQPVYSNESNQFYDKQYCAFYRELGGNVLIVSSRNNKLYITKDNSKNYVFFDDPDSLDSYSDDGATITCFWETPDITGHLFYKNKTLRYIAFKAQAALATSVKMYAMERGIVKAIYENELYAIDAGVWNLVYENEVFGRYLKFSKLIFSKFSFSTDITQKICRTKIKIKKVDKFRLRFENDKLNEPFGIDAIGLEYVENGNYKG